MSSLTSNTRSTEVPEIRSTRTLVSALPAAADRKSRTTPLARSADRVVLANPSTVTPTVADARTGQTGTSSDAMHNEDRQQQIERARESRTLLLARRYEKRNSREEDARYEILTLRMRRLSPRVSLADLERLNALADAEDVMRSDIEAMEREFGIR